MSLPVYILETAFYPVEDDAMFFKWLTGLSELALINLLRIISSDSSHTWSIPGNASFFESINMFHCPALNASGLLSPVIPHSSHSTFDVTSPIDLPWTLDTWLLSSFTESRIFVLHHFNCNTGGQWKVPLVVSCQSSKGFRFWTFGFWIFRSRMLNLARTS